MICSLALAMISRGSSELSPIISGGSVANSTRIIPDRFFRRHGWQCRLCSWRSRGGRVVCAYTGAYRTLNRWSLVIVGVTPQPGGYPSVKGFVCPRAHHHQRSPRPSSSGKAAFFLSSHSPTLAPVPLARSGPKRSSLGCQAGEPRSILVAGTPATFRDWNNAPVN